MRNFFIGAVMLFLMTSIQAQATGTVTPANPSNTQTVYGPKEFFSALGKGKEYNELFNARSNADGVMTVINGSGRDLYTVQCQGTKAQKLVCELENAAKVVETALFRAKAVEILLNNNVILSQGTLDPRAGKIQVALKTLTGIPVNSVQNKLKIKLVGALASKISVEIKAQNGTVNQLPIARILASPPNGIAPLVVNFSGVQSSDPDGSIASYEWNFGDPSSGATNTAIGSIATHTYSVAGNYIISLTVRDNQGAAATSTQVISIVPNTSPIARITASPETGEAPLTVALNGSGSSDSDGTIVDHQWNFGDNSNSSGAQVNHTFTDPGQYNVILTVRDDKGASANVQKTIVVVPLNIAPNAVIKLSRNQGISPLMVAFNATDSSDSDGSIAEYNWNFGDGTTGAGARVNHEYGTGNFTVTLKVKDNLGKESSVSVTISAVNPVLPPDPVLVAPALSSTQNSLPADMTKFLYTGPNPIQVGVVEGTIDKRHVSVIRGRILQEDDQPLSGAVVKVLGDSRYGQTTTRADGRFDLAVNGGGSLVISIERNGFYSVQRRVSSSHLAFATLDDIYMLRPDSKVTVVASNSNVPQVAKGSTASDSDGNRTATVMLPSQTGASLRMADGSLVPAPQLSIRAKEYTVGPNGPKKMPAELPSTSAYTYAVQLTADEVEATGAKGIQFSKPISFYVENFLGFSPGDAMPVGIYNPEKGRWEPSKNGRVIKVLSIQNGKAILDVTGTGSASAADLAQLGIDDEELGVLGSSYQVGASLWRVRLNHFSIADINVYQEDVAKVNVPTKSPSSPTDVQDPCAPVKPEIPGSIIQPESRTLGESVDILGTPFSLNYTTDRVPGRLAARTLDIPITPDDLSDFPRMQGVDLKVVVAGREYKESFSAAPGQSKRYVWDGLDAYGRNVYSGQPAEVHVGFRVSANYLKADRNISDDETFAFLGPGLTVTAIPSREETVFTRIYKTYVGVNESVVHQGLAGWTLSPHHVYDPVTRTLYTGDGFKRSVKDIGNVITTAVGNGTPGFSGDGSLATQAQITLPGEITIGSDNSIYFKDIGNYRIRKVSPDGIISTIAGNGIYGFSGDGGPATNASVGTYGGIAVDTEGEKAIYFSDYAFAHIRKISADGTISTIAGSGTAGYSGDGGPAINAKLNGPVEIVAKDGHVYFNDGFNNRIRVIRPNGTIHTVAGNGVAGFSGDGGPAVQASISQPLGLAMGPNGDLYITDSNNRRVRRIDRSGIIRTVAGGGSNTADGVLATEASLIFPTRVVFSKDGTMYISTPTSPVVRRVSPDGIISTFAGTSEPGAGMAEGELAGRVRLIEPYVMAIGPDDSIYVVEQQQHKIKKISRAFAGVGDTDIVIPSSDGSEMLIFDSTGKHLATRHSMTGAIKYSFEYTADNRVSKIIDGDGNATTIVRNSSGIPTQIIAPFGQVTNLSVGNDGYLSSITNPNGESYSMSYGNGGLISSFAKPRGYPSTFTYNELGQLVKDQDAAGGFTELSEQLIFGGYSVTYSTAEERYSSIDLQTDSSGRQISTHIDPDGLVTESVNNFNGLTTVYMPTRGISSVSKSDPRIGAGVQYTSAQATRLDSGQTFNQTMSRSVSTQPGNLFNFVQSDTIVTNGRMSTSKFDSPSRTWSMRSVEGREQKVIVDSQNRPIRTQIAGRNDQVSSYNERGLLAQVANGQRTTTYAYDSKGRLASVTNSIGQAISYNYDNADRVIQTTYPDGRVVGTTYDANGNVIGVTPAGKPQHLIGFDLVDMLISYLPPILGGPETSLYSYNLDKQLKTIQRPDGNFANYFYVPYSEKLQRISTSNGDHLFSYDSFTGLLSQATSPDGVVSSFTYNGDFLASSTNSIQGAGSISFTHDSDFRVSSSNVNGTSLVEYSYDGDGLLVATGPMTFSYSPLNGQLSASQVGNFSTSFAYSAFGDLDQVSAISSGNLLYGADILRDEIGRISSKTEQVAGISTSYSYAYDSSGRLVTVNKNGEATQYTYDSNGNRLSFARGGQLITGVYNNQDQLLSYGGTTYTYKAGGDVATKTKNGATTKYLTDVFGNLKSVELPDGRIISYISDAQNRRVGKAVNGVKSKFWLYESQLRIAAELDSSGQLISRFIYGQGHSPEVMIKGGVTYKLVSDHLGSIRLVVNSLTGDIAQRIEYDEFGQEVSDSNPGFQPFGFAGGLYDADTGLVRFGARDYDAETGRWTAKDPILFDGGDTNLFGYSWNDPLNFIDPSGLSGDGKSLPIQPTLNNPINFVRLLPPKPAPTPLPPLPLGPLPPPRQPYPWEFTPPTNLPPAPKILPLPNRVHGGRRACLNPSAVVK